MVPRKYEALSRWLAERTDQEVVLTFDEMGALVGGLPASSSQRTWWANSGHGQSMAWLDAGWVVDRVDFSSKVVRFLRGAASSRPGTGRSVILDGTAALRITLERAGWRSITAAVAAHTVFLHPDTVSQTGGRALFPVVRDPGRRGVFGTLPDSREVLFDDNTTPTDSFLWAARRTKGPDVQFNHVWNASRDPDAYTALWNVCCTPAFLAKTSDTHPETVAALRYRSWELYGYLPQGEAAPKPPLGYEELEWAASPEPVDNLEDELRVRMRAAPSHRATVVAARLGWLFSGGADASLARAT